MPCLAELQWRFARSLLEDAWDLSAPLFAESTTPIAAALQVHRNTVLGALAKALALTFPTVSALVGEAFFDQAAATYVGLDAPRRAGLAAYGDRFPEFLASYGPASALTYLADVARLDLAIERAGTTPLLSLLLTVDDQVALSLPISLSVLELSHPADLIRAGVEECDDEALAAIDLETRPRWLAVWRDRPGAVVRWLSPPAGVFLGQLLTGSGPEQALTSASACGGLESALLAIQAEVFAAPFTTVIQHPQERPEP